MAVGLAIRSCRSLVGQCLLCGDIRNHPSTEYMAGLKLLEKLRHGTPLKELATGPTSPMPTG
jgi:hypothetical protein